MKVVLKAAAILVVLVGVAAGATLLVKPKPADFAPHTRGPQNAQVSLIEYGDYECPPCFSYRYHVIIDQLIAKYPAIVHYEYRHFPITEIHPTALPAAMAAEAAGAQDRFWEMHRLLLTSHETWARNPNARDVFIELAATLPIDLPRFLRDLDSKPIGERILQQAADAREAGIRGVPTFLINNERLDPTPTTFEEFNNAVLKAMREPGGK